MSKRKRFHRLLNANFLCDWWLESRAKCPETGDVSAEDAYGAPLYFCRRHWAMIAQQSHYKDVRARKP